MKVLIAGDLLPYDRVARLFDTGHYDIVFGQIRERVASADYSIVNLECPICKGEEKAIKKLGPSHKCSISVIDAIKYVGFKCVTLANNHFRDFGDEGCLNTVNELEKYGIDYVGGGRNAEQAADILYREIDGKRLAFISCCEHEFSIADEKHAGSNPLNPIKQFYAIEEAREKADYIFVIVHGGHEHYQLPSPRMQETYRFFIDAGADVVVNHHQHCYSGYEVYHGKPIFYGLGNFCFDKPSKRSQIWNEGYMVELSFDENCKVVFQLLPYIQCDENPVIEFGIDNDLFNKKVDELNQIIVDGEKLSVYFERWCQSKYSQKESLFSPFSGTFLQKLYAKGFLPSLLSTRRLLELTDHIDCESHRDVTINYLHSTI